MYYLERMKNETREWWTGEDWSDVDTDAMFWHDFQRDCAESVQDDEGGSITWME